MRKRIVIVAIFALMSVTPMAQAWECEYGEVNGWVKFEDENQWEKATLHQASLKIHEPFKIKIEITANTNCHVGLKIYDPGITKVYEMEKGPSKNDQIIDYSNCPAGWTKTYEWTVRPTGNFTGGTAPLNVYVQFTKTPSNYDSIEKSLLNAYISSSEWQDGNGDGDNGGDDGRGGTPGFGASEVFAAMALAALVVLYYKRRAG